MDNSIEILTTLGKYVMKIWRRIKKPYIVPKDTQTIQYWLKNNPLEIQLLAYTGSSLVNERLLIEDLLVHGTRLEFILLDPESSTRNYVKDHILSGSNPGENDHIFDKTSLVNWANSKYKSLINFCLTDLYLPYSLLIVKYKNRRDDFIKVDFYHTKNDRKCNPAYALRGFVVRRKKSEADFLYFEHDFKSVWDYETSRDKINKIKQDKKN